MKSRKTISTAVLAGLIGCGVSDNNQDLTRINGLQGQVEQLQLQHTPKDFGSLEIKDGENGSVSLMLKKGKDWQGDGWKLLRNGKQITSQGVSDSTFTDLGLTDGTEYGYSVLSFDNGGHLVDGVQIENNFIPFDEKFDYELDSKVQDVRFDDNGNVTVDGDFTTGAAGNSVNGVEYTLITVDGDTLSTKNFNSLTEAKKPFTLNSGDYRGDVKVLSKLKLEQGEPVVSGVEGVVLDDMPQLIWKANSQNKSYRGFDMQVTDFDDKAHADKLIGKISKNPGAVDFKDSWVYAKSVDHANELVGKWVTADGKIVNSYEEAFETPVVVAEDAKVSDWKYNPDYCLADVDLDGKFDHVVMQPGNTVSGALEAAADRAGAEFDITGYNAEDRSFTVKGSDKTYDLDDLVKANRGEHNLDNFDPSKVRPGDHLVFSKDFKDMLYPEAEKQAEEGNPWFGFRFTFEVPDYSPDDEVKEILRDQPNVLRDQPAAESNLEESRRDHTAGVGVKFSDSYSDLGFGVTGSYQFPIGDNVSVGPFATVYGDNNFDFGGKLSVDVDDWRISGLAGSSVKDIKDRTENQGILGGSIGHKLGDLYLEIGANINGLRKAFGGDFKERVSPFATLSIPFGGSEEPSRYQPSNLMPSLNEFADEGDLNNVVFVEYDLDSNGKIDYHDKNLFVNAHRGHNQCQWDISSYGPGKVNSYDFFEGIIRDGHEGSLDRSVLDAKNQRFIEGFEDYKENIRPNLN